MGEGVQRETRVAVRKTWTARWTGVCSVDGVGDISGVGPTKCKEHVALVRRESGEHVKLDRSIAMYSDSEGDWEKVKSDRDARGYIQESWEGVEADRNRWRRSISR